MATNRDLFLSILALDSYNRGYLPGIEGLSDAVGTQIGKASISATPEDIAAAQAAAFYAVAYTVPNGAVDGITSVQGILGAADSRRSVACGRSLRRSERSLMALPIHVLAIERSDDRSAL